MPYLSVHFKEKRTPDGEQVYFAVSENGRNWTSLNGGRPVLESRLGTCGVRDIEIVRKKAGGFVLLATDLCVARRTDEHGNIDWKDINHNGSGYLSCWESPDLVHWGEQRLLYFGRDDFGCLWAPEVFFDEAAGDYLIHWGSTVAADGFSHMSIYCTRTRDFRSFSPPELFFTKNNGILDSHIVKVGETYHLFYKNSSDPAGNMHETAPSLSGPWTHDNGFDAVMRYYTNAGAYEAPTTFTLPDGRWCLMLDFFGCPKEQMGYVPYVSPAPGRTDFRRADSEFTFPYGFKHGRFLPVSEAEYRLLADVYGK